MGKKLKKFCKRSTKVPEEKVHENLDTNENYTVARSFLINRLLTIRELGRNIIGVDLLNRILRERETTG